MMANPNIMPIMHGNGYTHQYYNQQHQIDPVSQFRQRLNQVTTSDKQKIEELTELAKLCHQRFSNQIADSLIEKILSSPNRLTYMYILDSILKNVQGNYIQLFEERITQVFQETFHRAQSLEEKKSLIKMFKIWDLFFTPQILDQISRNLELQEYVINILVQQTYQEKRLLTDEDLEKVRRFKRIFEPNFLPEEVINNGLYITGSDTNIAEFQRRFGQTTSQQTTIQPYGQARPGVYGRQEGMMMQMGQTNPVHQQQMTGQSNFIPSATSGVNIGGQIPQQPYQGSEQIVEMLKQLNKYQNPQIRQGGIQNEIQLGQQTIQQQNPPYQQQNSQYHQPRGSLPGQVHQQQSYHGVVMRNQINSDQNQRSGQGIVGINQGSSQYPHHGGAGSSQLYTNTHIDDNFLHKQQTVDHKQIGFLPSILKSFYLFKEHQQLLLGQDQRLNGYHIQGKQVIPPSFGDPQTLKEFNLLAIAEVYDNVKFQCSVCGMRFIRNYTLKKHLDMHFQKSNEFRKRGNRAVSRPQFMSIKDFIQPKSSFSNQKGVKGGQGGIGGQLNVEDMVPYMNKDSYCYICKEKFEVIFDDDEEQWFFVNAKRIRMPNKKQVVTVHTDCIKQIEMNRGIQKQQNQDEETKEKALSESNGDKPRDIIYEEKQELLPIDELEKQIRGIIQSKKEQNVNKINDYDVDDFDIVHAKKIMLTKSEVLNKHPSEFGIPEEREKLNYKGKLAKNQVFLFNLPSKITKEQIEDICKDKNIQVLDVEFRESLSNEKYAYAKVTLKQASQVRPLKDKFKNFWIKDQKVKLLAYDELNYETFDNRTVIINNIPNHYKNKQLIELFQDFGSIVSIELPQKNILVEERIQDQKDRFVEERREKQEQEFKRAQFIVHQSIKENEEYLRMLEKYFGQEKALQILESYAPKDKNTLVTQQEVLNSQKNYTYTSMLTNLQLEDAQLQQTKKAIMKLKVMNEEEAPGLGNPNNSELTKELQSELEKTSKHDDSIKRAIYYLNQNKDDIDQNTLSQLNQQFNYDVSSSTKDPIQVLQQLSKQELALAYDRLLTLLDQREKIIEFRLTKNIEHMGIEERILFEQKDWNKEIEDIKTFNDPFNENAKIENIISINDQIQMVQELKDVSPYRRLYLFITKQYNPFIKMNFDPQTIKNAESEILDEMRIPVSPMDPMLPPTLNRLGFEGYKMNDEDLKQIQDYVEEVRDRFDLPFDELYHKEKKLVDQVIKAEQALKEKEKYLEDPMGANRIFDPKQFKDEISRDFDIEPQFYKDQRKIQNKLQQENIDKGSSDFEFQIKDGTSQNSLFDSKLSQKDQDLINRMKEESQHVNLGYAFVTFAHTDEARIAMILGGQTAKDTGLDVDIYLKNPNVDHKDFDFQYKMNRMRNDSKLTEEYKNLRESRQQLREFEDNMDKDLVSILKSFNQFVQPSLKRLKEFRDMARDVVENKPYQQRDHSSQPRTQVEEEQLNEKIRQMQKENPDRDFTQLFDTERAEIARKVTHKKAFASYKAYQFLKHGIDVQKNKAPSNRQQDQKETNVFQSYDPFNFPPVEETVARYLSKDNEFNILDSGETINKPGRRFAYTDNDFMEAYLGKDQARMPASKEQNHIFGYNDTLKRLYPVDKYLQLPKLDALKRQAEEKNIFTKDMQDTTDPYFTIMKDNMDFDNAIDRGDYLLDVQHPEDPKRSLITDAENRLDAYMKRKEKQEGRPIWDTSEVGKLRVKLTNEYFPKTDKKRWARAKEQEIGEGLPVQEGDDTKTTQKFEPYYEGEGGIKEQNSHNEQEVIVKKAESKKKQAENKVEEAEVFTKEGANYPFIAGTVEYNIKQETLASEEQRAVNREYVYDIKHKLKTDREFDFEDQPKHLQKQKRQADVNNMQTDEFLDTLKDWGNITPNDSYGGQMTQKVKYGTETHEYEVKNRNRIPKNLKDYAEEQDLSEREDEDIYAHYMEQMRRAKLEDAKNAIQDKQTKLAQEQLNKKLDEIYPDLPRFEGFFKSQSQGKHPFEEDEFSKFEQKSDRKERENEQKYDEELFKRELEGRLIGENLTARQFGLLYNAKLQDGKHIDFIKDDQRQQFITQRDLVRLIDEQLESIRRNLVLTGKCTEEQSYVKMKEITKKMEEDVRKLEEQKKQEEAIRYFEEIVKSTRNPKSLIEKEFYFDEGLGESVSQYMDKIKAEFPNVEISTRRDRDGYPLIKVAFKPKYKYNLDEIEKFDPIAYNEKAKESLEDIMKVMLAKQAGNDLQSLDRTQLEGLIRNMTNQKQHDQYDFDQKTKDEIANLWKERLHGKYSNDREGFTQALLQLSDNATYDNTKKLNLSQLANQDDKIREELFNDRFLMTQELTEQLTLRVREHLYMKQRKPTDFVGGKKSEVSAFNSKLWSYDNSLKNLESNLEENKEGTENFNMEAYQQIKAEIKKRREAKERLLKQGFPELKSYISI